MNSGGLAKVGIKGHGGAKCLPDNISDRIHCEARKKLYERGKGEKVEEKKEEHKKIP